MKAAGLGLKHAARNSPPDLCRGALLRRCLGGSEAQPPAAGQSLALGGRGSVSAAGCGTRLCCCSYLFLQAHFGTSTPCCGLQQRCPQHLIRHVHLRSSSAFVSAAPRSKLWVSRSVHCSFRDTSFMMNFGRFRERKTFLNSWQDSDP